MASTRQMTTQRNALRLAQRSICAGCGQHIPSHRKLKRHHPDYPTFDHVVPRSQGGGRTLANGLLKHQRCNQQRGARIASGCDRIWQAVVAAVLRARAESPQTLKRNNITSPSCTT